MANWKPAPVPEQQPASSGPLEEMVPELGQVLVLGWQVPLAALLLPLPVIALYLLFLYARHRSGQRPADPPPADD